MWSDYKNHNLRTFLSKKLMFFTDHVYTHQLYPHPSVQVFVETTYTIRMYQSYLPTRHDGPLSFLTQCLVRSVTLTSYACFLHSKGNIQDQVTGVPAAGRPRQRRVRISYSASAHWSSRFEPDAGVLGRLLCLCGRRTAPKATEGEAVHIGWFRWQPCKAGELLFAV
jgi:hypothetical protein